MSESSIRVLIVDDEEELVSHLEKRLRARGLQVTGASSGDDAVDVARAETFDVAVVDLKMPGMDGIETLRELRDLQPMLNVIMLTGHGSFEAAHQSGRNEAFRFLTKPHEFDKLLEAIQEAYDAKVTFQREGYQEELAELVGGPHTPREIMAETDRLRKKYEQ